MNIEVLQADYLDPRHARDMGQLLETYASDPMGGATPLAAGVRDKLAAESALRPMRSTPPWATPCFGRKIWQARGLHEQLDR